MPEQSQRSDEERRRKSCLELGDLALESVGVNGVGELEEIPNGMRAAHERLVPEHSAAIDVEKEGE